MKTLLSAIILFISSQVQAHSGHDHQHWLSSPIHILTTIAIVAIIAVAYKMIKNHKTDRLKGK
ncbi:MAG: hypothetical protein ACRBBR_00770 [Cellvibrionaceae bacterium]